MHLAGIEQGRENRRGKIAAIAAKDRRLAIRIAGDEASHHHAWLRIRHAPLGQASRAGVPVDDGAEFAMPHAQHLARIQPGIVAAALAQAGVQQV